MNTENSVVGAEYETSRQSNRKKRNVNIGSIVLMFVLWVALVAGGFYAAKVYFDQAMLKIQQANSMNVQALNERMGSLALELKELKVLLNVADQAISTSGSLQRDLYERITLLDAQLKSLEESLKILKEAP